MYDNAEALAFIQQVILCPMSGQVLEIKNSQIYSPANEIEFPATGGIPWIFRNPQEQILQWRYKIKSVIDYYEKQSLRAESELNQVELLSSTRERLSHLQVSYKKTAKNFDDMLSLLQSETVSHKELEGVFYEKVPRQQTVKAYHDTIFRDWVWGKAEIEAQFELLRPMFKDTKRMLVLGAGACGLPIHVHQATQCPETLAVDINPIFFLMLKKLMSAETVGLTEHPNIPVSKDCVSMDHTIQSLDGVKGFHLLFADGQNINLKKGAFSTLLTPWFIDIIPRNFRELARHLNQCLEKGGRWINIGQLDFHRYQLSEVFSREEIAESLKEAGFVIEEMKTAALPYLQSPYDMVGRRDQVFIFSAVKDKTAKEPSRYEYLPEWLIDWNAPVPLRPEIQNFQVKTNVFAQTINQVNGKNSLNDIAAALTRQFGLPPQAAREAVYNFFINVYEQIIFREF